MAGKIKALQQWCRRQCEGYRDVNITNMTSSWKSGLAFCAMIHRYRPDLIDYDVLFKEDVYENNKLAFDVARDKLNIPALLDPEDMVNMEVPDKLCILTYVAQYYNCFHDKTPLGGPGVRVSGGGRRMSLKRGSISRQGNLLLQQQRSCGPVINESTTDEPFSTSGEHNTLTVPDDDLRPDPQLLGRRRSSTLDDRCHLCGEKVYLLERHMSSTGRLCHRHCYRDTQRAAGTRRPSVAPTDNKENLLPAPPDATARRSSRSNIYSITESGHAGKSDARVAIRVEDVTEKKEKKKQQSENERKTDENQNVDRQLTKGTSTTAQKTIGAGQREEAGQRNSGPVASSSSQPGVTSSLAQVPKMKTLGTKSDRPLSYPSTVKLPGPFVVTTSAAELSRPAQSTTTPSRIVVSSPAGGQKTTPDVRNGTSNPPTATTTTTTTTSRQSSAVVTSASSEQSNVMARARPAASLLTSSLSNSPQSSTTAPSDTSQKRSTVAAFSPSPSTTNNVVTTSSSSQISPRSPFKGDPKNGAAAASPAWTPSAGVCLRSVNRPDESVVVRARPSSVVIPKSAFSISTPVQHRAQNDVITASTTAGSPTASNFRSDNSRPLPAAATANILVTTSPSTSVTSVQTASRSVLGDRISNRLGTTQKSVSHSDLSSLRAATPKTGSTSTAIGKYAVGPASPRQTTQKLPAENTSSTGPEKAAVGAVVEDRRRPLSVYSAWSPGPPHVVTKGETFAVTAQLPVIHRPTSIPSLEQATSTASGNVGVGGSEKTSVAITTTTATVSTSLSVGETRRHLPVVKQMSSPVILRVSGVTGGSGQGSVKVISQLANEDRRNVEIGSKTPEATAGAKDKEAGSASARGPIQCLAEECDRKFLLTGNAKEIDSSKIYEKKQSEYATSANLANGQPRQPTSTPGGQVDRTQSSIQTSDDDVSGQPPQEGSKPYLTKWQQELERRQATRAANGRRQAADHSDDEVAVASTSPRAAGSGKPRCISAYYETPPTAETTTPKTTDRRRDDARTEWQREAERRKDARGGVYVDPEKHPRARLAVKSAGSTENIIAAMAAGAAGDGNRSGKDGSPSGKASSVSRSCADLTSVGQASSSSSTKKKTANSKSVEPEVGSPIVPARGMMRKLTDMLRWSAVRLTSSTNDVSKVGRDEPAAPISPLCSSAESGRTTSGEAGSTASSSGSSKTQSERQRQLTSSKSADEVERPTRPASTVMLRVQTVRMPPDADECAESGSEGRGRFQRPSANEDVFSGDEGIVVGGIRVNVESPRDPPSSAGAAAAGRPTSGAGLLNVNSQNDSDDYEDDDGSDDDDEISRRLDELDGSLRELELDGRLLEDRIRNETDEAIEDSKNDLMVEWFQLIRRRNELVREECALIYKRQQLDLERLHEELQFQLRALMSRPDDSKTTSDRQLEQTLFTELVDTVTMRNNIIENMEVDRRRYEEEDKELEDMMAATGLRTRRRSSVLMKSRRQGLRKNKKKKISEADTANGSLTKMKKKKFFNFSLHRKLPSLKKANATGTSPGI